MTARPDIPVLASAVIRQALVPMVAFYLILMAALAVGLRGLHRGEAGPVRPAGENGEPLGGPATGPGARRGWAALIRHVLGTVLGGYLLLMAVAVAYYYGVARVGGAFLHSAVTGAALLVGLSMPVFAAASWVSERAHGRRGKPKGKGQPPPK